MNEPNTLETLRAQIETLDEGVLAALEGRSLFLTREWSQPELATLLNLADVFQELDRAKVHVPLFKDELFLALFFDASTRTRSAWAGASARLGAHPVILDGGSTQVSHGETAEETGAMLGMNAHALGIRHDLILGEGNTFMRAAHRGIVDYLDTISDSRAVPVVNLQCDVDHPTQSLADLAWLRERFPKGLQGKTLAMSWAYSPSYAKPLSVPQGVITLMTRFGMHVRLAHPPGYELMRETVEFARNFAKQHGGSFQVGHDMDEAFEGADIVYPKSWAPYSVMERRTVLLNNKDTEGLKTLEQECLTMNGDHKDWECTEDKMKLTKNGKALYMHCLPADRGQEVTDDVIDGPQSVVFDEAGNRLHAQKALMITIMGRK